MQQTRSDWKPIRLLAVLLVAVLTIGILAACGGAAPAEDAAPADSAEAADSGSDEGMAEADDDVSPNQAPALQEMVRNGDLPPLSGTSTGQSGSRRTGGWHRPVRRHLEYCPGRRLRYRLARAYRQLHSPDGLVTAVGGRRAQCGRRCHR